MLTEKDNHADFCGNTSQHSGRNGGWCCVCRNDGTEHGSNSCRSVCSFSWYCNSEFSGRCDHQSAFAQRRGNEPHKGISIWYRIRYCRAGCRWNHGSSFPGDETGPSLSSGLCGRSYALCCGRRAHTGGQ